MGQIVSPEMLVFFNLNQMPGNYPKQDNLNKWLDAHLNAADQVKFQGSSCGIYSGQIPTAVGLSANITLYPNKL